MKSLFALVAVLALGCSSSQKKTTDDAASVAPAVEAPAAASDAMPAAPADAGPAVVADPAPAAATDDEHPPMPTPK